MKALPLFLVLPALVSAQALTPGEIADGWIQLFDGETTFGWTSELKANWRVDGGAIVANSGEYGWLRTNSVFSDFILKVDYKTAADGNSGVFLRSAAGDKPHVTGYELQIFQTHPKFPTGSLVESIKAKPVTPAPDQWHTFEVTAQGDHFTVKLDGKRILDGRDGKSKAGYIGLQFNKDKPVAFRNVKLKPLGMSPLFDGKSLKGWAVVQPPTPAAEPAVWTVKKGNIHVEHGGGQLETEATFQNFVLQLDVKTNPKDANHHPNSGVFLRGEPKGYWTGYESQIRNEFKDGDRTKPVDFGTGGMYFYQPARKVMGTDGQYFTKTVVASGRHFAVWINGYQASDWEDTRAEGNNARKEARLTPGAISLQAHDPTTNLDFRKIRVAKLP